MNSNVVKAKFERYCLFVPHIVSLKTDKGRYLHPETIKAYDHFAAGYAAALVDLNHCPGCEGCDADPCDVRKLGT